MPATASDAAPPKLWPIKVVTGPNSSDANWVAARKSETFVVKLNQVKTSPRFKFIEIVFAFY